MMPEMNIRECRKARKQALEEVERLEGEIGLMEEQYIAEKGIVNSDGAVPCSVSEIEDDEEFVKARAFCAGLITKTGLIKNLVLAEQALREAEDKLVASMHEMLPKMIAQEKELVKMVLPKNPAMRESTGDRNQQPDTEQEVCRSLQEAQRLAAEAAGIVKKAVPEWKGDVDIVRLAAAMLAQSDIELQKEIDKFYARQNPEKDGTPRQEGHDVKL